MKASSTVVIKVKYGEMLRRFNAPVVDDKLFLNMDGLREKILSLFSFAADTDLSLTYVDEDGDVVALVDDDDLRDVVKQSLNPLRVTVKVNDKNDNQTYSSATPTPLPHVQPHPNLSASINEILRNVPEPLRETLLKVSADLASKASSSSPPVISELVENLSKVSLSYLGQPSGSAVPPNVQNDVPQSSKAKDNKDSAPLKAAAKSVKAKPQATMERNDVKAQNVTGPRATFDFNAVAAALESQNANISKPESGGVSHCVRRREKVKKNIECLNGKSQATSNPLAAANNVEKVDNKLTGKDIGSSSVPKLGSNPGDGSSDLGNGNPVTDSTKSAVIDAFKKATTPTWSPYKDAVNFGSYFGNNAMYECPFSGTPLEIVSAAPLHSAPDAVPFRRSNSENDGSLNIFHRGVRCDGCGIHPIVGPRFKSKVKVDYDLCRVCYSKMGNDKDYVRMDSPAVYRHHLPHFRVRDQGAMSPHVYRGFKVKPGAAKLDSRFIQDVNIFDGTLMAPLTPFTKIWRMRNNGTVAWPQKTQLVWIGGDKLTDTHSMEVQTPAAGLQTDQELDIAIDFISPELPGRYISYWRMSSPSGQKFGQRVWVLIQVDASTTKESPRDSVRNLNLNLPPVSSSLNDLEIINVDADPAVEAGRLKAGNSEKIVESELPNTENELKFPINDSLLVGNGAGSSSSPPSAPLPVPYPIIDLSDAVPPPPSVSPTVLLPTPLPPPPPFPTATHSTTTTTPTPMPPPPPPFPAATHSITTTTPMPPPPPPPPAVLVASEPDPKIHPLTLLIRGVSRAGITRRGKGICRVSPTILLPTPLPSPPPFPAATPAMPTLMPPPPPPPPAVLVASEPDSELLEDALLRELEAMGFKQIDLNKEVLRMNEYDLERSVDDLCGVSEWDPILEELQEMGFDNTEKNKKLLKKNNGSIKRVVMDLIAGEGEEDV